MNEKIGLSRHDLAAVFLDLLQHQEGMEHVAELSVSEINDPDCESNWRVTALEKDRNDIRHVIIVIERIQDELRKLYRLVPDIPLQCPS